MKRFITLIVISIAISLSACAQAYNIEVKIDGLKDTTLLLGYHFGEKKFVADTAQVDNKGVAVFKGDSLLPGGMYIIILPQHTFFDILVSKNQKFGVSTSSEKLLDDLKFSNSPENSAFADYQRFMSIKQKRMGELRSEIQNISGNKEREQEIANEINALDKEVKAYWDKIVADFPGFVG